MVSNYLKPAIFFFFYPQVTGLHPIWYFKTRQVAKSKRVACYLIRRAAIVVACNIVDVKEQE